MFAKLSSHAHQRINDRLSELTSQAEVLRVVENSIPSILKVQNRSEVIVRVKTLHSIRYLPDGSNGDTITCAVDTQTFTVKTVMLTRSAELSRMRKVG